jgi:hypothetical protein
MKKYYRQKWGGLSFLVAMVLIGYAAIPLPGNELFPFYSWSMFSLVPSEKNAFTVFIHEVNGQPLLPPREFQQAGQLVHAPHSVVAYKVIQKLGDAYKNGTPQAQAQMKELFEKNYLPQPMRYALVHMNYDPLTRWKNGGRTLEPMFEWVRSE